MPVRAGDSLSASAVKKGVDAYDFLIGFRRKREVNPMNKRGNFEDMGTVLLSYRATHKRTGLLPAASLPDWRMGMPAAKAFRIDASHCVPLQRPASCRLSLPDGSEANLPHETVKSLRRQDKRTVPSSPPVSQKLSG